MQYCTETNCFEKGKICIPTTPHPRIVIIGGGFAGLSLVKKLHKEPVQIVLFDKNNYNQFLPLLYQVATSGIEPDNIVFPFRKIFAMQSNVIYRMAEVTEINSSQSTIKTSIGAIKYDFLIIATGSRTNYFSNQDITKYGLGLKSLNDALNIRRALLINFEKASVTCIKEERELLISIAIAGGGPAGVEMAGALAEFKKYVLPKDYPELKGIEMKIFLLEGSNRILQGMTEKLSNKTLKYLSNLKVDVKLNTFVNSFNGSEIKLNNGENLKVANLIWTAGVKGSSPSGLSPEVINGNKQIIVDEFNRVRTIKNVYAIGDVAHMDSNNYPNGHPMVAQTAIQQGKSLAKNLKKTIREEAMIPFKYNDKGSLATVGMKKAVAFINHREFSGFFAWILWSVVHLFSIIGVRNKLLIALNWMWSYFNYDKSDRVIISNSIEENKF